MTWPRVLATVAVLAAVLAVAVFSLWPFLRHQAMFPGGRLAPEEGDPARWGLPGAEVVWLEAEDGVRLHGWWIPAEGAACGAVVYFHGNGNTIAPRAWLGERLSALGLDVLLFDYRGYGLSEGRPSGSGLGRDARAAWRHVVEQRGIPPERVVLFGHSLGSAVAAGLALERPGAATLVLGAPFPGFPTLFQHHAPWLPVGILPWNGAELDAGSRIGRLEMPLVVLAGESDRLIPARFSRAVFEAAPEPKRWVLTGAEHNTLVGHPAVWGALAELLETRLPCG